MDIDSDRDGGGAKRGTKRLFEGIEENDDCFKAYAQSRPRLRICPFQVSPIDSRPLVASLSLLFLPAGVQPKG